jgi:ubiquitin C-terminal hydrolase
MCNARYSFLILPPATILIDCKECKHESARVDHYLDIPLVIRGFGETIPVKSVEEALHKFVQPEVLDKENQYNCEKCSKKVKRRLGIIKS